MADKAVREIKASGVLLRVPEGQTISIFTQGLTNESSDPINSRLITEKIETELLRAFGGDLIVLDRSPEALEAVRKERAAKRSGAVANTSGRTSPVLGADFLLKGKIQDRVLQARDRKSAYYLVTFELTDLESSRKYWKGDYEAKFDSEKSVIAR